MDRDELVTLTDMFKNRTDRDAAMCQAEYSVQFLFRDLFSSGDVIGPCFMMNRSMSSSVIDSLVRETLMAFYRKDFRIIALVFDGASANLSYAKSMFSEHISGSFGKSCSVDYSGERLPDDLEQFRVPSSIPHPIEPDGRLFVVVCPSHVLKIMVNALHSSRIGGTREFWNAGSFGWDQIESVYEREVERRMDPTKITMVPGLLKSHVQRDSWTKLSVAPALIMVRENLIAEMKACGGDSVHTVACVKYLEALNMLFVCGILSHDKIFSLDSPPLTSMIDGFRYFCSWYEALEEPECSTTFRRRNFLSWQTFDILRLMFFGFIDLCDAVWKLKPGSYVVGLKVNGSAVETLFSQIKQRSGQEMNSTNYLTARRSLIATRDVDLSNRKRDADTCPGGYRNTDLGLSLIKRQRNA